LGKKFVKIDKFLEIAKILLPLENHCRGISFCKFHCSRSRVILYGFMVIFEDFKVRVILFDSSVISNTPE
jgi:hypothetical protein